VAFELDGELVGTVRAVPIGYDLTLAEKLRRQAGVEPLDTYLNGWEMGRLVISPEYRGGPESLRGFLYLSLSFLHGMSPVGSLHATCTSVLARLYRRFGFAVVAKEVPLLGTTKSYTLIHGYFSHVIAELAESNEAIASVAPSAVARGGFAANTNQGAYA
jgi:hypothetical protein